MRRAALETLTCLKPEDLFGDECRLDISVDGAQQKPLKQGMKRKLMWDLSLLYHFQNKIELKLWDEDAPAFADPNDWLGTVTINTDLQPEAEAWFFRDNACYRLCYRVGSVFVLTASVGQGGNNQTADILALKRRFIELGFIWLTENDKLDQETVQVIKLFQSIIIGRQSVQGDGRVDVPGQTYSWLQAFNAPRWQLMPAGDAKKGFVNFERADPNDTHDYGTDWLAATIEKAGARYYTNYLAHNAGKAPISVNDSSLPHGGDTPDHAGHETGLGCDLRLPHSDGQSGGITVNSAKYDREAMRAMLTAISDQPLWQRTFFNDAALIAEGLCTWCADHDDHAHVEVGPPVRAD